MEPRLKQKIETITGRKIIHIQPLAGGMISQVVRLDLDNRDSVVAKLGSGTHDLTIEAWMLDYLRQRSSLPVPRALHAEANLLLIELIDGAVGLDAGSQAHLGELLAECHQIKAAAYGLERDTLIGPIHQPNPSSESWIEFFREQRLLYMAGIARQSGNLPPALDMRLQRFAEMVDRYLIEPPAPALIHGDMWRTNIMVRRSRIVGIIDPALYYAHNEMELAYMTLFGSAGDDFFASYMQILSLEPAFFELRRHIYNLYPLLAHLAIFGSKYQQPLDSVLRRFSF